MKNAKKVTFLRHISIFISLIGVAPIIFLIVRVIYNNPSPGVIALVVGGLMILGCMYLIAYASCYWITFYPDKVYVSGEIMHATRKTQYKDTVMYCDIKDVRLVIAHKNSLKQPLPAIDKAYERTVWFIEFEVEDNRTHWMFITGFTSRQIQKMLDIIGEKTGIQREYKQLVKDAKERQKKDTMHWKP